MEPSDDFICFKCKHFNPIDGCPAFPDGTPIEKIIEKGHDEVYRDQKGDFVFKERTHVI